MGFNGSGTFNRNTGVYTGASAWQNTRDASRNIRADDHDTHDQDIATGLSTAICKDGQTTITANLPMAGFRHTNVGSAVARTDYLATNQEQDRSTTHGGTSGGSANAQTITLTPAITAYVTGQIFTFVAGFTTTTTTPTININSVGAKSIVTPGLTSMFAGAIQSGATYAIMYDGTRFVLLNPYGGTQSSAPTPSANGGGSLSSIVTNRSQYWVSGSQVKYAFSFSFTVTGTCNSVRVPLPIAAASSAETITGVSVDIGGGNVAGFTGAVGGGASVDVFHYASTAFAAGASRTCAGIITYSWV